MTCLLWAQLSGILSSPPPILCCAPEPTLHPFHEHHPCCLHITRTAPPLSHFHITPAYPEAGQPSPVWWHCSSLSFSHPEEGQPSPVWWHCSFLSFSHPAVPRSFGFAVLFGVQAQECPLHKSQLPSSTDLVRSRFLSCISAWTTQLLQNRTADSSAALPWLMTDLLSHLVWKFTASEAGCSLLILFYSLAKRLKPAVRPACREHALGSGSLPSTPLPQGSDCKYPDNKVQPNTINRCFPSVSGEKGGEKKGKNME